jgi:hypothetical protein
MEPRDSEAGYLAGRDAMTTNRNRYGIDIEHLGPGAEESDVARYVEYLEQAGVSPSDEDAQERAWEAWLAADGDYERALAELARAEESEDGGSCPAGDCSACSTGWAGCPFAACCFTAARAAGMGQESWAQMCRELVRDDAARRVEDATDAVKAIADVIAAAGEFAHGGEDPAAVGREWLEAGFNADETAEWLSARCFDAMAARALADAGVSPEDAARQHADGETVGYRVANGDIGPARAAALLRQ